MKDPARTNQKLIEENAFLKQRIRELEKAESERMRMEQAYKDSELLYRSLIEHSSDVVFCVDQNGEYKFVNQVFASTFGKTADYFLGKTFWDIYPKEHADHRQATSIKVFETGESQSVEVVVPLPDRTLYFIAKANPLRDETGKVVLNLTHATDITERKQAEEALRESEEKYRTLVENASDIVFRTDENGNFTFVNPVVSRITGYTAEELIGKRYTIVMRPDMCDASIKFYGRQFVKRLQNTYAEYPIITKEGHEIWFGQNTQLIVKDGHVSGFQVVARDITERKLAEEALRLQEMQLRTILESTGDGILAVDNAGRVIRTNQRFADIWKVPSDLLERGNDEALLTYVLGQLVDPGAFLEKVHALYASKTEDFDMIFFKDGRILERYSCPLLNEGVISGRVWSFRDITERKQVENALQKSEEMLRLITDNMSDMIRVTDLQGVNLYASPSHFKGLGYRPEERVGKPAFDIIHPDDLEKVIKAFSEGLAANRPASLEYRVRHADGHYVWLETVGDLLRDAQGNVTAVVMSSRDVSERRQAEETLRESEVLQRTLLVNLPAGVIIIDPLTRMIESVNDTAAAMFGVQAEHIVGHRCHAFLCPASEDACPICDLGKEVDNAEREMVCADGSRRPVLKSVIRVQMRGQEKLLECFVDITAQKRAEEAMRESEKRYRSIFETTLEGIYQTTPQGRYLRVNPAFAFMLGYASPEDLIGSITDIGTQVYVNPERRSEFKRRLSEHDRVENFENLLYRKDGTTMWGLINGVTVRNENGEILYYTGGMLDITERKRAEDALRESEEKYRVLVEAAGEAIFIAQGGIIKFCNKRFSDISGYEPADLANMPFNDLVHPDDRQMVFDRYIQRLEGKDVPSRYRFRFVDARGNTRWADMSVALLSWEGKLASLCLAADITELKQAEEALKKSERNLSDIIEFLPDATFVIDLEGKVIAWNRAIEEMTGIRKEEMIGQGDHAYTIPFYGERRRQLLDLIDESDKELESKYKSVQRKGNTLYAEAFAPALYGGKGAHFWATGAPLFDDSGNRVGAIESIRDITERVQTEEEKRSLEERLNRAEKMEALGTLAGGVAHDLNNVLGVVVGYAELLMMKADESSSIRPQLVNIMNGGLKAAAIVDDLLTLARRGVSDRDVLNLNKIIADCQMSPELEKLYSCHPSVKIKTDITPDLPNISGSSVHLGKSLYNLISNASEAMTKGGIVTIKTTNEYLDKPIQGYDQIREGDYVVLSVSDTGEGISADNLKRIFEPFYTKKVMGRSGTGLGLAVVWGTVRDHHGYINVESEEGKGSTFTLYFPVTKEDITSKAVAVPVSEYMGNGESILVVDDVKEQRDLAAGMLIALNYNVSCVSSGEEAIVYLKEHKIDLMFLDMIMDPGMDGLDTYKQVLQIHPKQKAIIVSGFSESDRVRAAKGRGAGAYVKKPYIKEKLGLAVRRELDRK